MGPIVAGPVRDLRRSVGGSPRTTLTRRLCLVNRQSLNFELFQPAPERGARYS
jgi:hypothetical protein